MDVNDVILSNLDSDFEKFKKSYMKQNATGAGAVPTLE